MNTQHTPGPWKIRIDLRPAHLTVDKIEGDLRSVIARFNSSDLCDEHGGDIMANARLIAAAPDLLAALREIEDQMRGMSAHLAGHANGKPQLSLGLLSEGAMESANKARAAIAKSESTQ